jgi:hypothetical protein
VPLIDGMTNAFRACRGASKLKRESLMLRRAFA